LATFFLAFFTSYYFLQFFTASLASVLFNFLNSSGKVVFWRTCGSALEHPLFFFFEEQQLLATVVVVWKGCSAPNVSHKFQYVSYHTFNSITPGGTHRLQK